MAIKFLYEPQTLMPGDLLLTRLNFHDPAFLVHLLVAAGTHSKFAHGTMVTRALDARSMPQEWSVGAAGPILRPASTDVECWAYRINSPNWQDIGQFASDWLIARLPKAEHRYDWMGAGFVGIQALMGIQKRQPWKNTVPYCFEGITDAYWQIGFDVVPWLEPGAVLGQDIDESTRRVCAGSSAPLLCRL